MMLTKIKYPYLCVNKDTKTIPSEEANIQLVKEYSFNMLKKKCILDEVLIR